MDCENARRETHLTWKFKTVSCALIFSGRVIIQGKVRGLLQMRIELTSGNGINADWSVSYFVF